MKKPRVLIIEDDIWLAENYSRLLSSKYQVSHCTNGYVAIDLFDSLRPDVVILDVLLTGASAFTLLHELQSYSDTGNIPIIMCTNLADDMKIPDLESYGVVKLLNKATMIPSDILTALKSVLK